MEQKFYICRHCGNIVGMIHFSGVPIMCCGAPMEELKANTVEASMEKHIPVVIQDGSGIKVEIGEIEHPMEEAHHIQWIYLQTSKGGQRKNLKPGEKPMAEFSLVDEEAVAVFEYCNIHGLWKKEL